MQRLDLIGQKYNRLTVIKLDHIKNYKIFWLTKCDCGNDFVVPTSNLRNGHTKSCGCLRIEATRDRSLKTIDSSEVFNRLTVERFFEMRNNSAYFLCKCLCGNVAIVLGDYLRSGHTQSCGCLQKDRAAETQFKHGLTHTRIHRIWCGMMQRCYNPNNPDYKDYGGRNIIVCPEWQTFESYFADNGESYYKHVEEFGEDNTSADRWPSVDGNYERGNFRWATWTEQQRNRRNSVKTEDYDSHRYFKKKIFSTINNVLSGKVLRSSVVRKYVGCTEQELKDYIEFQFEPWMNWGNRGNGIGKWNIDHIKQCHEFDLTKEADRLECFNIKNLRPYCSIKNTLEQYRPTLVTIL